MTLILQSHYLSEKFISDLLSDKSVIQHMLAVECALAEAQSALGMIPRDTAGKISKSLRNFSPDPKELSEDTAKNGIVTIALINKAREKLKAPERGYLHYGATSQDIVDTAQVLIIKEALTSFEKTLIRILQNFKGRIEETIDVPAVGRTRTQHAVPVTVGLKIAGWALPLVRHLDRLQELRPRVLVCQLGGAAGTLAFFGDRGLELVKAFASRLKLNALLLPWHNQRDGIAECAAWLAGVSGSLGKVAEDIKILSYTEIAEVSETQFSDGGMSSSMPHKKNPVISEAVVALARLNASLLSSQFQALIHANERDASAWIIEWVGLSHMMNNTGAALSHMDKISGTFEIHRDNVRKNLEKANGLIMSEAATFHLSKQVSAPEAKETVRKACALVAEEKISLEAALTRLAPKVTLKWREILKPEAYLGESNHMAKFALEQIERVLQSHE